MWSLRNVRGKRPNAEGSGRDSSVGDWTFVSRMFIIFISRTLVWILDHLEMRKGLDLGKEKGLKGD